jgi:hypothetical protein
MTADMNLFFLRKHLRVMNERSSQRSIKETVSADGMCTKSDTRTPVHVYGDTKELHVPHTQGSV